MANEIKVQAILTLRNGYLADQFAPGQINVTQAAVGRAGHAQLIGTVEEDIDLGDVVAPRWCALRNLDEDNYIEVGPEQTLYGDGSMVAMIRLLPGEVALMPLAPGMTLKGQANTAACLLDVHAYET